MNREGAETYLRLLAEAEMRGLATPAQPQPWAGIGGWGTIKMMAVAQALTAVRALDLETAEDILTDFELAMAARRIHDQLRPGPTGAKPGWPASLRIGGAGPLTRASTMIRKPVATATGPAGAAEPEPAGPGEADRFVPIGLTIPFHDEAISGDLYLMSFAHTAAHARFIAVWGIRSLFLPGRMGLHHPDLIPFEQFTVTDDRGGRYQLKFTPGGGPEWTSEIGLRPDPPGDIRWLDIAGPGDPAVRVELGAAPGVAPAAQVSEAEFSTGEHLLIMLAEQLLAVAPDFPPYLRQQLAELPAGPLKTLTIGLGDIIAALEAADVLSPLSPLPGRIATLCAGLNLAGHGISAPPAPDLPEPWLSLLAHYQRRKPDIAPVRDGYAAVAAALPELDGIRLALLGLHNTDGSSSLHVLARGLTPESYPGPLGLDMYFPLSVWIRDDAGRWHAARPAGWHRARPDHAIRLQLVPPLTRPTSWIEVLAGGQSAEVRARLPLRWGSPS